MNRRSILLFLISLVLLFAWGCGDDDNTDDEKSSNDDTEQTTDSTSDTFKDTESETEPNVELGTDPPETNYDGFEDLYILTDDDDPEDICRVRFDLVSVAEPAVPCTICEWDVVVERQNSQIMVNVNNACENSELGLSEETISGMVGERLAYGFAAESTGHANTLMKFNVESARWEELTISNWDSLESRFRYKRRDGICAFAAEGETKQLKSGICGISGEATVTIGDE